MYASVIAHDADPLDVPARTGTANGRWRREVEINGVAAAS